MSDQTTVIEDEVDDNASRLLQEDVADICRCRFIEQYDGPAPYYFEAQGKRYVYQEIRVGVYTSRSETGSSGRPLPSAEDAIRGFIQSFILDADANVGSRDIPRYIVWRLRPQILKIDGGYYARGRFVMLQGRAVADEAAQLRKAQDAKKSTVSD